MVLEGLTALLGSHPALEVVGVAASVEVAWPLIAEFEPDVVVTDHQLRDGTGIELAERMFQAKLQSKLLLTSGRGNVVIGDALAAGCAGFVSKDQTGDELIAAVLAVAGGAAVFPAGLLRELAHNDSTGTGATLTDREHQILRLLADANTVSDISTQLVLSVHTVRNHIQSILTKLHARNQLEAVVIAARAGLIDLGPS